MATQLISVKVIEGGRIVIPATIRRAMEIHDGDSLVLEVQADGIKLRTRGEGLRRARARLAKYKVAGRSRADELIAERRTEANG